MRVIQSEFKRPLNLLAIGARGHIAAASSEFGVRGDVEVWELTSGNLLFSQTLCEREVRSLGFTPDGEYLLAGTDDKLAFLKVSSGKIESGPKLMLGYPKFALTAISETGSRLFVVEHVNQYARLACWEVAVGPAFRQLWADIWTAYPNFDAPTIAPDGGQVAAVVQFRGSPSRPAQSVHVRDAIDGKTRLEIPCDASSPIEELQFMTNGSLLLARPPGRIVNVFDATTGQPTGELIHRGRAYVSSMAVHPSGLLACSRNNGTVCFWNVEKRELVRILDWKLGKLVSVAFSPDGCIGAAGTEDGKVIVWDMDE